MGSFRASFPVTFFLALGPLVVFAGACPSRVSSDELTCAEQESIDSRLEKFYGGDASAMDRVNPKFSPARGEFIHPKPELRGEQNASDPLLRAAGVKATEKYSRYYCEHFLKKHFPELRCDEPSTAGRATVEKDDAIETLLDGWMARELAYSLDKIPVQSKTRLPVWGDDYWSLQYGGLSYRYAEGKEFKNYKEAIADYAQPSQLQKLINGGLGIEQLSAAIEKWSPAEKYDLTVGDTRFGLTLAEKGAGEKLKKANGDVESWMGICDGWAGAAVMAPAPVGPVKVTGYGGVQVTWTPHDVRALTSLLWAHGQTTTNNVGGRCDAKYASKYPNGRLKQQNCFDTNPATFHLALGNLIGIAGASFVMDNTFDYEVWNQPLVGYSFEYYNPLDPKQRSTDWKKVAVPYDRAFKQRDRFQRPLTRGKRSRNGDYDDRGIRAIVGVIAAVDYLEETTPIAGAKPAENNVTRETMTYDLELYEEEGALYPGGGEWHNNAHPDFLWVPRKGSSATSTFDRGRIRFDGRSAPEENEGLTKLAHEASTKSDVPLCQVVKTLVEASSGRRGYSCSPR